MKNYKLFVVLCEKIGIEYDIPYKHSSLILVPAVRILGQLMSLKVFYLQDLINAFDGSVVNPL